jgi:hypothetical protein
MHRFAIAAAILLGTAPVVFANEFRALSDRTEFMATVEGRELRLGLFGVSLEILPDGRIDGSASGWPLTGSWSWEDGFFCREMDWGGTEIPYNCQLVEVKNDAQIRFTVDRGAGDSASFNLR